MDLNLLTRVESHATDLFKLGQEAQNEGEKGALGFKKRPRRRLGSGAPLPSAPPLVSDRIFEPTPPRPPKRGATSTEPEGSPRSLPKAKSVPFSLETLAEENDEAADKRAQSPVPSPTRGKTPAKLSGSKDDFFFQSWISMRRLPVEEQEKIHYEDLFGCFTRNFGKGFALGFMGKVLLTVFSELVFSLRSRRFHWHVFSRSLDGAKDHGLFLALLLATHNSIMYATKDINHSYARYRGSAAGFIAGLVSLAYLPHSMRRSVILFALVRAFELACRMLAKRKIVPSLENGDTALMSASSAFMLWTWLFYPNALDKSYVHFLTRQVQVPVPVVRAVATAQAGLPIENLEALNAARKSMAPKGLSIAPITDPFGYDSPSFSAAEKAAVILHPGQSFTAFAVKYFVNGLRNAAPVYAPVYAVPLVLFSRKRLIRQPIPTITSAAMGAARSSAFLALYCTLGICSISVGRQLGLRYDTIGKAAVILPFLSGIVAGTSTLIEKKSRRIELALYVMSKAVEGLHGILKEKLGERIASPPGGDALLFACIFSIICHANLRHPELVRGSYRALLMRFFDTEHRHKFF